LGFGRPWRLTVVIRIPEALGWICGQLRNGLDATDHGLLMSDRFDQIFSALAPIADIKIDVVDTKVSATINTQGVALYSSPGTPKLGAVDGSIARLT
jgi:hypothetical protein